MTKKRIYSFALLSGLLCNDHFNCDLPFSVWGQVVTGIKLSFDRYCTLPHVGEIVPMILLFLLFIYDIYCISGALELVDVSSDLPNLKRSPGLKTWKVILSSYTYCYIYRMHISCNSLRGSIGLNWYPGQFKVYSFPFHNPHCCMCSCRVIPCETKLDNWSFIQFFNFVPDSHTMWNLLCYC